MDRVLVYPGQTPLETDELNTNRWAMEGLGRFIDAVLGTSTLVNGLVVAPNGPPALNVVVGSGEVYALSNLDSSPYSSLAADTDANHQIIKQGILRDPVTLATAAPGTGGFSINYLIQATFQEADAGSVVLPYYNASNPAVAWSGPLNSGTPNFTIRQGKAVVSVKAGTAAATGTQTTPAPDAGNVGLAVVTVANGQANVGAGNIALYSPSPYISETLTQKISQTTGDLRYLLITAAQTLANTYFGTAGGGPTAYTGSLTPTPGGLTDGMRIWGNFSATNSGTGPTLNLNSLGAKVIFQPDGTTQLPPSTLPLNAELMYRTAINSGAGGWVLLGVPAAASTTLAGIVRLDTVAEAKAGTSAALAVTPAGLAGVLLADTMNAVNDTGGANAIAVAPTPAWTSYAIYQRIRFKLNTTAAAGATTINVSGLGTKSVKVYGADPFGGMLIAGQIYEAVYDGTNVQVLNPTISYFESSEITLNTGAQGTVSHGLGAMPKRIDLVIRCKIAEFGFAVGDEYSMVPNHDTGGDHGIAAYRNATTIGYIFSNNAIQIYQNTGITTGQSTNLTPGSWKLVLRAWNY